MKKEFKIKDESGDRKYFTQIPNIIVNHSTAYEQSLYLIMKRVAGENGSCYASLNWLSLKMGVHKTTVANTIKKLLKRDWIKEVCPVKVRGGQVRQFIIIDLWKKNIKEYESGVNMTSAIMTTKQESGAVVDESGANIDESGAKTDTKKNHKKIYEEDKEAMPSIADNINPLLELFKTINPNYEQLFKNKTQRAAMERMTAKFGKEKMENGIKTLPQLFGKKFAPIITTPVQLENKMGELIAFLNKERSQKTRARIIE